MDSGVNVYIYLNKCDLQTVVLAVKNPVMVTVGKQKFNLTIGQWTIQPLHHIS